MTQKQKYMTLRQEIIWLMQSKERAIEAGDLKKARVLDTNFKELWKQAKSIYPKLKQERLNSDKNDSTIQKITAWLTTIIK